MQSGIPDFLAHFQNTDILKNSVTPINVIAWYWNLHILLGGMKDKFWLKYQIMQLGIPDYKLIFQKKVVLKHSVTSIHINAQCLNLHTLLCRIKDTFWLIK